MILVLEQANALKLIMSRLPANTLILKIPFLFLYFIPLCLLSQSNTELNKPPAQNDKNESKSKTDTSIQKDLEEIIGATLHLKSKLPRKGKKQVYFSLLPVSSTVPRGSQASLSTTNGAFYLGQIRNTSVSTITFSPYPAFDGRYIFPISTNIWLSKNTWKITGDIRFMVNPQDSWGLGGNTPQKEKVYVRYNYFRLYQTIFKKIAPDFFIGLGYNLDDHFHIRTDNDTLQKFANYDYGTGRNSLSLGLTFNIMYDSRDNSINPMSGWYSNFIYRGNSIFFGNRQNWQSLYIDARRYIPFSLTKQKVLAIWTYYWTILNGNPPYLDLPSIGWDINTNSGRGFEQNRYRSKSLFYLETEYRSDITKNGLLGYVLFANLHSAAEYPGGQFAYWHPAAGLGLRLKLDKKSRANICIDYAFSKNHSGFALNIGERF